MPNRLCKYSILSLWVVVALASCSKVPNGVLPEKKMKDVLIDMHLAENLINTNYHSYPDSASRVALYEGVFRKHKITQAVYDSSLVWYGRNLDLLMQIYDLALNDINEQIRALGDVQASAAPSVNQDSVNIWPRRDYLTLYPGALFNGTVFDVEPENEYLPGSTFVLVMRVWGISPQMRHTPEVRIAAELADTTFVTNEKITREGHHEIILRTPATKRPQRVYGYIRMDHGETGYYKIYIDSLRLMRYNYGSRTLRQQPADLTDAADSI
jgi:hypothetical protein